MRKISCTRSSTSAACPLGGPPTGRRSRRGAPNDLVEIEGNRSARDRRLPIGAGHGHGSSVLWREPRGTFHGKRPRLRPAASCSSKRGSWPWSARPVTSRRSRPGHSSTSAPNPGGGVSPRPADVHAHRRSELRGRIGGRRREPNALDSQQGGQGLDVRAHSRPLRTSNRASGPAPNVKRLQRAASPDPRSDRFQRGVTPETATPRPRCAPPVAPHRLTRAPGRDLPAGHRRHQPEAEVERAGGPAGRGAAMVTAVAVFRGGAAGSLTRAERRGSMSASHAAITT